MLRAILIIILTVFFVTCAVIDNSHDSKFTSLKGPYVGQTPPGAEPKLFAPGIISTGLYTRDVAITPDGKELYYCVAVGNFGYATKSRERHFANTCEAVSNW